MNLTKQISVEPLGCTYRASYPFSVDQVSTGDILEVSPLGATRRVGQAYLHSKMPRRYYARNRLGFYIGGHASMGSAFDHVVASAQTDRVTEEEWFGHTEHGIIDDGTARQQVEDIVFLIARNLLVDPGLLDLNFVWEDCFTLQTDDFWGGFYHPDYSLEAMQSMVLDKYSPIHLAFLR